MYPFSQDQSLTERIFLARNTFASTGQTGIVRLNPIPFISRPILAPLGGGFYLAPNAGFIVIVVASKYSPFVGLPFISETIPLVASICHNPTISLNFR
jgi:hypothetical protein